MKYIARIIGISLGVIIVIFIGIISDKAIDITGILISIYTLILIYKERKTANYNQKTIELRNEMYIVLEHVFEPRLSTFSYSYDSIVELSMPIFISLFNRIKAHNNDSLVIEFCIHRSVGRLMESIKSLRGTYPKIEDIFIINKKDILFIMQKRYEILCDGDTKCDMDILKTIC